MGTISSAITDPLKSINDLVARLGQFEKWKPRACLIKKNLFRYHIKRLMSMMYKTVSIVRPIAKFGGGNIGLWWDNAHTSKICGKYLCENLQVLECVLHDGCCQHSNAYYRVTRQQHISQVWQPFPLNFAWGYVAINACLNVLKSCCWSGQKFLGNRTSVFQQKKKNTSSI